MSISATNTSVLLGTTITLTATVSNTSNATVEWSVDGAPGGNAAVGTISAGGVFTAPAILPSPAAVRVQAASVADPTKTAQVTVTIVSDISVNISPANASTELGAQQNFQAGITSAGNPNAGIVWALSGEGCFGSACGSISSNGVFSAPPIIPSPPIETISATSVADPLKKAIANITITSNFGFAVSGPSAVSVGASAGFAATLTPIPNSNPNLAITWAVLGAGCANAACGTIATSGVGAVATYTAPASAPSPNSVTITATPQAAPLRAVAITIAIVSQGGITLALSPAGATLAVGNRQTFTALIQNGSNAGLVWSVAGVAGGNSALGQICVVGSNPCQTVTSASPGSVDYIAPGALPSPNPVTLSVASQTNPASSASSSITVIPHLVVSVSPPSVTVAPNSNQDFSAIVEGTSNQQVTWNVTGAACSAPGLPCGMIDPTGLYQAPATAPTPDSFDVVATSAADETQMGFAAVSITGGPTILSLLPSSVTAGAAGGFELLVEGANFVPAGPGPGSSILIGGALRITTCDSSSDCSTPLSSSDVAAATNLSIAIQNPDGSISNTVTFVIVPAPTAAANIPLTPGAPAATGEDIIVTDLSTNGSSAPSEDVSLSVGAIGVFETSTDNCTLNGGPVTITIPLSNQATSSVCVFSVAGLAPSYIYTLTGPSPNDMSVVGETPLGLGIVGLTFEFSSTTAPGPRTLFIQNASLDLAAATGAIDVE